MLVLVTITYEGKEIKEKKEVVDEYELVKATMVFNNEKEPTQWIGVDFTFEEGIFPEVDE